MRKPSRLKESRERAKARHEMILNAGWRNDEAVLADLGSQERCTWFVGRCAADPEREHPYAVGIHLWDDRIKEYRQRRAKENQP